MIYAVVLGVIFLLRSLPAKIYVTIVSILLILVSGLRGVNVGIDTFTYSNIYKSIGNNSLLQSLAVQDIEKGYIYFNYIVSRSFLGSFQFVVALSALLSVTVISVIILKYSYNTWLSFYIFVSMGLYTFGMSGLRQAIALAFTSLAFLCIAEKKIITFVALVLLACSFHTSAAIFLPAFLFRYVKINKIMITLYVVSCAALYLFVELSFDFLNSYARLAYDKMDTGGLYTYSFYVITASIGLLVIDKENKDVKLVYFMLLATIALWPIAKMHQALFRITYYYSVFLIIFIPNMLKSVAEKNLRVIMTGGYLAVSTYFFIDKIIFSNIQLLPYEFFWE